MRGRFIAWWLLLSLLAGACQSVQPVPQEDPMAREVPQDLTVRFVYQVVGDLRDSFEQGDAAGFMRHVSEGYYGGRARLEENLKLSFAVMKDRSLIVEIVDVELEEKSINAVVSWKSTFTHTSAGAKEKSGETILVFHRADTIKLVTFRRDPLFGMEGS